MKRIILFSLIAFSLTASSQRRRIVEPVFDITPEEAMAQYDFDDAFDAIKAYPGPVICFNGQEDETGAHDAGLRQIEIYNERDSGTAEFVSLENSGHSYAAFSQAAKEITLARLRQFIGVI